MYLFALERQDLHLRHTGYKPVALLTELRSIMGCDQYLNKLVAVYKGVLIEYFRPSVCPSELLSLYNEQNE